MRPLVNNYISAQGNIFVRVFSTRGRYETTVHSSRPSGKCHARIEVIVDSKDPGRGRLPWLSVPTPGGSGVIQKGPIATPLPYPRAVDRSFAKHNAYALTIHFHVPSQYNNRPGKLHHDDEPIDSRVATTNIQRPEFDRSGSVLAWVLHARVLWLQYPWVPPGPQLRQGRSSRSARLWT